MVYTGKKVLVCGMVLSGTAAAWLLLENGASVTLSDLKEEPEVDAALLEHERVLTCFGRNPDDILDGHDLIVLSPGIPTDLPFITNARQMGITIWSEVELASRHCKAPMMAITGTNGKTTTVSMAGQIMSAAFPGSVIAGNIGIAFSSQAPEIREDAWAVAEISSFQLETIDEFRPKISAVLNITPDHLNRHKTMEGYIAAKARIFENQTKSDYCILNYDNKHSFDMAANNPANVLFFSKNELEEGVFVRGDGVWIKWGEHDCEVMKLSDIPVPGDHNLENVMAAVAMCAIAGAPMEVIAKGIKEFVAVEHRLEFVTEIGGVAYFNDSKATNVDSAIKGIEGVNALGKPVVLIGGGFDKGGEFSEYVKAFEGKVKTFIAIGETADSLIETCRAHNFPNYERANTLKDAVQIAASRSESGDAVLLSPACAAWGMFDNYEQRGRIFKEFVNDLRS